MRPKNLGLWAPMQTVSDTALLDREAAELTDGGFSYCDNN